MLVQRRDSHRCARCARGRWPEERNERLHGLRLRFLRRASNTHAPGDSFSRPRDRCRRALESTVGERASGDLTSSTTASRGSRSYSVISTRQPSLQAPQRACVRHHRRGCSRVFRRSRVDVRRPLRRPYTIPAIQPRGPGRWHPRPAFVLASVDMGAWYRRVGFCAGTLVVGGCCGRSTTANSSPAPVIMGTPHPENPPSGSETPPPSRDETAVGVSSSGSSAAPGDGVDGPKGCSSTVHPANETCAECLVRCCVDRGCQGNAACLGYADCTAECKKGLPCGQGCSADCTTGSEPVCYFMDCHRWMCSHACGG